jgi:uncharacterized protein YihD (DUF1040 family)
MYLKAVNKKIGDAPFDFEEFDINRRKLLTVIEGTPILENVGKSIKKHFEINNAENNNPVQIHELLDAQKQAIGTPVSFNTKIISEAIKMTAEDALNQVNNMLSQNKFNRDDMKSKLELLDLTTKIAKEVGMNNVLENLNKEQVSPYKGTNFASTLKQIQNKVNEKNVKKQVEPAKGVTL